jgi:hypothetical protein
MDNNKFVKYGIFTLLAVFIFLTILSFSTGNLELIGDKFVAIGMLLMALLWYKSFNLSIPTAIIGAFALILHHLKLYGNVYMGLPFDRWMHFIATLAIALIIFEYFKEHNKNKALSLFAICMISMMVALGAGSIIEIVEFMGYSFLGEGEGLLRYGVGDFGEWNNACWDLMCNTLGAFVGVTIMWFIEVLGIKFKRN